MFLEMVGFLTVMFGSVAILSGLVIFWHEWLEYRKRVNKLWREHYPQKDEEEEDDE